MQPPNIFPTHVALKAESVTARRHGAVIGELAALAFVALYLVGDGIWLLCARIRLRVRARNLARAQEIAALRQTVAREKRLGAPHPESGTAVIHPRQRCKDCRCLA